VLSTNKLLNNQHFTRLLDKILNKKMADIINTSGRRKTAVARVYLSEGSGNFTINGKDYKEYFPTLVLQYKVHQSFKTTETDGKYDFKANIDGGGITGQ